MLIISGRRVNLYPLGESDLKILFEWRNSPSFMGYCSTRRNKVSFEEFCSEISFDFSKDRDEQWIIHRKNIPVGTIYSYGTNQTDGYTFITIYLDEKYRAMGLGAEAFILFADYLFHKHSLFKIYTDVYDYNLQSIAALEGAGFIREGLFREHRLFGGNRHDLIRYAFYHHQIEEKKLLLNNLTR